eukprot:2385436-Pleurochrysis_carterae.AAC.2
MRAVSGRHTYRKLPEKIPMRSPVDSSSASNVRSSLTPVPGSARRRTRHGTDPRPRATEGR